MGQITAFNLEDFIKKYNITHYFETGTGEGVSLEYASKYNFQKLYSVDLDEELFKRAENRFKNDERIILVNNYSTEAIKNLLPTIENESTILFFLDAHFPGADFHKVTYEESIRHHKQNAFPLEQELNLINQIRNLKNDIIIIDDFVLYDKNQNYESIKHGQVWEYEWLQDELGIETKSEFIFDIFSNTHDLLRDYRHQGYLIITPKQI